MHQFPAIRKVLTICDILDAGYKPQLMPFTSTNKEKIAAFYEEFYFKALRAQGFDIQQEERNRFYHSTKKYHRLTKKNPYLLEYPENTFGN